MANRRRRRAGFGRRVRSRSAWGQDRIRYVGSDRQDHGVFQQHLPGVLHPDDTGSLPDTRLGNGCSTRSVTSAPVALQSNGTEISSSGYDVIRTANFRRSGAATIQPSKSLLRCLPAATTAASSSALRSRRKVSETEIVM